MTSICSFDFPCGSWNDFVGGTGYRYQDVDDTLSFRVDSDAKDSHPAFHNIFAQDDITVLRRLGCILL